MALTHIHVELVRQLCVGGGGIFGVTFVEDRGYVDLVEVHIQYVLVSPLVTMLHGVPGLKHLQDTHKVVLARGQHHHT